MRVLFPVFPPWQSKYITHSLSKATIATMARQKMAPKKIIQKPSTTPLARAHASKAARRSCIEQTMPVQVFESDIGVRGEVMLISPDTEKPLVVCANRGRAVISTEEADSGVNGVTQKRTHFVFIPGNPGVIEYYRHMLLMTVRRLPQDVRSAVTVHALGLPGHDLTGLNGSATFGIAAHRDYVLSYLQSDNIRPSLLHSNLILAGHSYGAYLSMEVLDMLSPSVVSRTSLFYLMPCLWQMAECAGLVQRLLLKNPLRMTTSSAWLASSLVPSKLTDYILSTQKYSADIEDCTRRLLSSSSSALHRNICYLAQNEMECITTLAKYPAIPRVASRSYMLSVENDRWCPPEAVNQIREAFGAGLTVENSERSAVRQIGHAFVLSYEQSEQVARIVSSWLTDLLRKSEDGDMDMTDKPSV